MQLLLTGAFNYSEKQIAEISDLGYKILFIPDEKVKLYQDISQIEVVVCNNLFLENDISNFKKLKLIQLTSAGTDRVPEKYIKENGIKLETALGVYSTPIAEWVILKILEIYKNSHKFYKYQSNNQWIKERNLFELTDKVISIIGFGNIGREVAKRLKAFNAKIIAVDINENILARYGNLFDKFDKITNLSLLLPESDVIILTLPLTDDTRNIVALNELCIMKDDAVLINVSRGAIINQSDLISVLNKGKFRGVALDVFEEEPLPKENALWNFENVLVTPHNAFVSDMNDTRLYNLIYLNLKVLISTK